MRTIHIACLIGPITLTIGGVAVASPVQPAEVARSERSDWSPGTDSHSARCRSGELAVPADAVQVTGATAAVPEIRVIYFVPADHSPDTAQEARVLQASRDVHRWYWDHTDNLQTIAWTLAVERVIGLQASGYYNADPWANVLTELTQRGYPIWGAEKVFMIWLKGGGLWAGGAFGPQWSGNAILGAENFVEGGCVPSHPSNWPCTPAGAMAHELGHAFGVPHPDVAGDWGGTSLNDNSVMGAHWNFPERAPRSYTVPSPWGLLNYERDHIRYNPLVNVVTTPFPVIPGDAMQQPNLPQPALSLSARRLTASTTQLEWNDDGAFSFYAYWSLAPSFASYAPIIGSPTSGTTLTSTDPSVPIIYFKVFEIPLSD